MDISINTVQSISFDDKSPLLSAKGTDTARPITLDLTRGFVSGTHYVDGFVLGFIPLGKLTAGTDMYGVYDDAAADGRQTCVGFLLGRERFPVGGTSVKIGGSLLWEGVVKLSKLPVSLDQNGQADLAAKFRLE